MRAFKCSIKFIKHGMKRCIVRWSFSFVGRAALFYVSHVLMMMLDIIWLSLVTSWWKEGHVPMQLEVILYLFERQLWNQTCITHCSRTRKPSLCGCHLEGNRRLCIYFWSCLRTRNIFPGGTVIFLSFHIIFGILESFIF